MAASEETSSLYPVFVLSILAFSLVPYTIFNLCHSLTKHTNAVHCQCTLCFKRKTLSKRISSFSTCRNFIILLLWTIVSFLVYYIKHTNHETQLFEPFSILGLEAGASDIEIKKAYRKLSMLYHPDKNPDPEAHGYFVEFISKAYQALTDPSSRQNYEKFGHPDGRQGFKMGIALPYFVMKVDGPAAGYVLLGIVGICIILPMTVAVIYLLRSSKYTSNYIMRQTMATYFYSMKPSLSLSDLVDIFIKAAEFCKIPTRKSDGEPLQNLFELAKNELNFNPKKTRVEQEKFWKQDPDLIKMKLLIHSQLTRQSNSLSSPLHRDLKYMLELAPSLLEELMKIALLPRSPFGHGWLRPAIEVVELSQNIIQAVPLSARKASAGNSQGIAAFMQLPHFNEAILKKISHEKLCTFLELRSMNMHKRSKLLEETTGFSSNEIHDIELVLKTMPVMTLDVSIRTENEEGIQEQDITTMHAWVNLKRENNVIASLPHTPYYPFYKEEIFWLILADSDTNEVWLSQKLNFMDEYQAISSAYKLTREIMEGLGASDEEVSEEVDLAVERVKKGSRLVIGRFLAPKEGAYNLVVYCLCDAWIGCDVKFELKLEISEKKCCGNCGRHVASEEHDDEEEVDGDYDSEYSDDDNDNDKEKRN